jgi:hypothetical protein
MTAYKFIETILRLARGYSRSEAIIIGTDVIGFIIVYQTNKPSLQVPMQSKGKGGDV